jgi:hypothetical protein
MSVILEVAKVRGCAGAQVRRCAGVQTKNAGWEAGVVVN